MGCLRPPETRKRRKKKGKRDEATADMFPEDE